MWVGNYIGLLHSVALGEAIRTNFLQLESPLIALKCCTLEKSMDFSINLIQLGRDFSFFFIFVMAVLLSSLKDKSHNKMIHGKHRRGEEF